MPAGNNKTHNKNKDNNKKVTNMSPKDNRTTDDIPEASTCCHHQQMLGNPMSPLSVVSSTRTIQMTSLSIARTIPTAAIEARLNTTTTTTAGATTTTMTTRVSTHVNLIEKMINDVSNNTTTKMIQPFLAEKSSSTSLLTPLHSNSPATSTTTHEIASVAGDFPSYKEKNVSGDDTSTMTDASNITITLCSGTDKELTSSTPSKLTTISPTAAVAAAAPPAVVETIEWDVAGSWRRRRQLPTTIINEMKSKSTENKCQPKELTTVSYQRELEANSTLEIAAAAGATWNIADLQNCERSRTPTPTLPEKEGLTTPSGDKKELIFAARNAKLKFEFFGKQENLEDTLKAETRLPNKTEATRQPKARAVPYSTLESNVANLELQLPVPTAFTSVLESPKLSLVAQRKADLNRRFAERSAIKSNTSSITASSQCKKHTNFPSVAQLKLRYDHQPRKPSPKMIVNPNKLTDTASPETQLLKPIDNIMEQRQSPLSDEGCNLGQSPYSSDDNEDNVSIRTTSTILERKRKDKVARSASSDSALGLEVDDAMTEVPARPATPTQKPQQQRRMTLTVTDLPLRPALLPLAEPTALPDSPTTELQVTATQTHQSVVPSKVLLEERVIEIPEDPRFMGCPSLSNSRRESAQSCLSDYPNSECSGVRFVRTPSVVVSDYSDDILCGITLEEIEYFRAQRLRRRRSSLDTSGTEKDADGAHSDVSASSSCSNLYYCGSTISALDGAECYVNGMRMSLPERKASDCSTCSAASGEDDDPFTIPEQPEESSSATSAGTTPTGQDLADLLTAQHLSTKRSKKVGISDLIGLKSQDLIMD